MPAAVETGVPVIDIGPLRREPKQARAAVGRALDQACRSYGFFSVVGHSIDSGLIDRLLSLSREFFARPDAEKGRIAMRRGGRAWRGWFPLGGELTSGRPDRKEGLYLGAELSPDDPRVLAGLPLHGPNLFPQRPAGLRAAVLEYIDACTRLGHELMRGLALGLELDEEHFARELTADPVILMRIFSYPPIEDAASGWGVAEHSDYGLLTILLQDDSGGLEVHGPDGWIDVPFVDGALVCNLGDMLDRMTGGLYRATPHRVRSPRGRPRISCPFFFDPGWDAAVRPLAIAEEATSAHAEAQRERWDGTDLATLDGTYGDYLLGKVSKVFPELGQQVLAPGTAEVGRPEPPHAESP